MRIALTQRVEFQKHLNETRDSIDQRWTKVLDSLGHIPILVPNNLRHTVEWIEAAGVEGLILTGGNDVGNLTDIGSQFGTRDLTEKLLLDWASKNTIPVIGICRGLQMINVFLGGKLRKIQDHVNVRHTLTTEKNDRLFGRFSSVNSYHNFGIHEQDLSNQLLPKAWSGNLIEAASHSTLPWIGLMWHPERENELKHTDKNIFLELFR